ncbi:hypothetical protein B4Q04_21570 [Zobellia sp. OII3]|nr:hypothetical protein B4Q04_21570 [Zobellia sp. OII3]
MVDNGYFAAIMILDTQFFFNFNNFSRFYSFSVLKFPKIKDVSNKPIPIPIGAPLTKSGNSMRRDAIGVIVIINNPVDIKIKAFLFVIFFML